MAIEVKERKEPAKYSREFEDLTYVAKEAGYALLGWVTAKVFSPVCVAAWANGEGTVALGVYGWILDGAFELQGVDAVTQLDTKKWVTTSTQSPVIAQPERGILKYGHPQAKLKVLLSNHREHLAELGGELVGRVFNLEDFAKFMREYLVYEMKGSPFRYWLRPEAIADEGRRDGVEGGYIDLASRSIRIVLENGRYIWGGLDIHDSGTYHIKSENEYECLVEFDSQLCPGKPKRIVITRKAKKYFFTELPGRVQVTETQRTDGATEFLRDSTERQGEGKPALGDGIPSGEYLPVEETVEESEMGFIQNVRKEVSPRLIKKGMLTGKKVKGKLSVLDDDAFRKYMRYGIEQFVLNQQGWSFIAFKAPIDAVANSLRKRKDVLEYQENVGAMKLAKNAEVKIENGKRHMFVVRFGGSEWCVIIQTVHWIEMEDIKLSLSLAKEVSAVLTSEAIAAFDDDVSGAAAVVFKNGKESKTLRDEDAWEEFYCLFYEQEIFLPESFIANEEGKAKLMLGGPPAERRVDAMEIRLPKGE